MIRGLFVVFFLFGAANDVFARSVVVRSGEHEGFTRLVLQMPDKVGWSFKRDGQQIKLTVDAPDIQFDTSGVFSRIPRARLSGLHQDGPGADLVFQLDCNCDVADFIQNPDFLVVDIMDPKELPTPRRQALVLPTNQRPYRLPSTIPQAAPVPILPPTPSFLTYTAPASPTKPVHQAAPISARHAGLQQSVNASEERLLAQIGRATSQGLLDVTLRPEDHVSTIPRVDEPDTEKPFDMHPQVSLAATTVIDRDLAAISQTLQPISADACLASDLFAVHKWGNGQLFDVEIGQRRSQLFEEFDQISAENALGLARAYLHFGFGAEALQALSVLPEPEPQYDILTALAELIDYGTLTGKNPFDGQQGCAGDVSLWAVIAADTLPKAVNVEAVLRAIARLPEHLRLHLGPQVSEKFAQAGDGEMAASVLRSVIRSGIETGSGIELAKAAVAQLHGDTEIANQELQNSVAAGSGQSPKALAKLIASQLRSRGTIAPDLPDLAAAYATEYRNGDLGPEMRRTHAIALAMVGRFTDAFETLEDLTDRDGQTARTDALKPLVALLSERADDLIFLQFSLATTPEQGPLLSENTRNAVAQRLLDLGFAAQAANWLTGQDNQHTSNERRLLRAKVSLAQNLPHRAMVELLGLTGPEVAKLRASAMMQNGDYRLAGQMLVTAEDFDGATRGFWLAEDWDAVPKRQNERYGQVVEATLKLKQPDRQAEGSPPLARARDLLQNSFVIRADIETLLKFVETDTVSQ